MDLALQEEEEAPGPFPHTWKRRKMYSAGCTIIYPPSLGKERGGEGGN